MRRVHVLTTAGHVDHGKSTLIERMTGIDPDRLAEEKARGLTIDLGFAWLTLPSGREIGIVDVPGHERFVHNMLAGAGSVDSVLFVVAANEGWMPQSEEHLQILDLLGADRAVVALTKSDTVDPVTLTSARSAIQARFAGTTLEDAEIVAVSAATGDGIGALCEAIDEMLSDAIEDRGRARLFVDRSFSAKGAGTVVTGTLTGGRLRLGDEVAILPAGTVARIRGIQSHRSSRDEAIPTARIALNLAGVDRASVKRGDAIVHNGASVPTETFDVELRAVRALDHRITGRAAFKCYIGSAEIDARLTLYETKGIGAGERAFARVRLEAPVAAAPFDRFVLRDAARARTVGGGVILDAHPGFRGPDRVAQLRARARAHPDEIPDIVLAERGVVPRAALPMLSGSNAPPRDAVATRSFFCSPEWLAAKQATIETTLGAHHEREPLSPGLPREEVRRATGVDDQTLFAELLALIADRVASDGPTMRLSSHVVRVDTVETDRLVAELRAAAMQPPSLAELEQRHDPSLVAALVGRGALVRITPDIVFAAELIDHAKERIAHAIQAEGALTAARLKDILGTTRKYAIPLLEYLDASGFTRRRGDVRELVSPRAP